MNIFWNAVGLIIASFALIFYLRLLTLMFRAVPRSRSWREWGWIATGAVGSILYFLYQLSSAVMNRPYSSSSDLKFIGLVLILPSVFFLRKIARRRV